MIRELVLVELLRLQCQALWLALGANTFNLVALDAGDDAGFPQRAKGNLLVGRAT